MPEFLLWQHSVLPLFFGVHDHKNVRSVILGDSKCFYLFFFKCVNGVLCDELNVLLCYCASPMTALGCSSSIKLLIV